MPEFVSVLHDEKSKTVVTQTKAHAKAFGSKVVDQPAVDKRGRPLAPRPLEEKSKNTNSGGSSAQSSKEATA